MTWSSSCKRISASWPSTAVESWRMAPSPAYWPTRRSWKATDWKCRIASEDKRGGEGPFPCEDKDMGAGNGIVRLPKQSQIAPRQMVQELTADVIAVAFGEAVP